MQPWMIVCSSIGGGLLVWALVRALDNYFKGARIRREHLRWMSELEADGFDLVRASIDYAMCKARLADRLDKMPPDFDPCVFDAEHLARAMHHIVLTKFEERRLAKAGTLHANLAATAAVPTPPAPPISEIVSVEKANGSSKTLRSSRWIGGRIVNDDAA